MKICCKCKQSKPLSEFFKNASRKDGIHPACKSCNLSERQRYVANNHEKVKSYFRNRYESDTEYRERQKDDAKTNWHLNAKERKAKHEEWKKQNPEYQTERYRNDPEYRKRNLNYSRMRKALRKGAEAAELVDRQTIIERDNATCYICGNGPLPDFEIHLDHVIPLSKGGPHTPDNVRVACVSCNCKKNGKPLDEVFRLIEAGLW